MMYCNSQVGSSIMDAKCVWFVSKLKLVCSMYNALPRLPARLSTLVCLPPDLHFPTTIPLSKIDRYDHSVGEFAVFAFPNVGS